MIKRREVGELRKQVVVQYVSDENQNTTGELEKTWATFATVWAAITPVSGGEFYAAGLTQASVTHRIEIRYLTGLTPKMRFLWGTRIFNIVLIRNLDERNDRMEMLAFEEV